MVETVPSYLYENKIVFWFTFLHLWTFVSVLIKFLSLYIYIDVCISDKWNILIRGMYKIR